MAHLAGHLVNVGKGSCDGRLRSRYLRSHRRSWASSACVAHKRPVRLSEGEVHVWWHRIRPGASGPPALLAKTLPEEERAFVEAGATAAQRHERMMTRILVRTVLSRYCAPEVAPATLRFDRNGAGKPHLLWPRPGFACPADLHFNVTHTASLIGCAVAQGHPVGLDAEGDARHLRSDVARLACRRFAPQEAAAVKAAGGPEDQRAAFLRLWTLKEAFVKALGTGIAAPPGLRGFTVSLDPDPAAAARAARSCVDALDLAWGPKASTPLLRVGFESTAHGSAAPGFLLFRPAPGHTAALCVVRGGAAVAGCGAVGGSAEAAAVIDSPNAARANGESVAAPAAVAVSETQRAARALRVRMWTLDEGMHAQGMDAEGLQVLGCS